jgi:ABC-type phosphate transport system substrate-binding protein
VHQLKKLLMVGGIAAAAVGVMASQALAEPPSTPSVTDLVAVGSDTTQAVSDQFQTDYNASTNAPPSYWSYDAVPAGNITPKAGCSSTTVRPNGSGAGIAELAKNLHPTGDSTNFCVDVARSSRDKQAGDPAGLTWVPFARDAVSWSANSTTNAPTSLTTAQLAAIYKCDDTALGGAGDPVTWDEVGGTGSDAVVPVIPQSSSGTRSFFLSQIGVTTAQLGSCVQPGGGQTNTTPEENEGTDPIFHNAATQADVIYPYSVAVYLAQTEHNHGAGNQGNLVLHSVNGTSPTTGTAPNATINTSFAYLRLVYNVVRGSGTVPANLQKLIGTGPGTGWICTSGSADVTSFGFLPLGANCGDLSDHT